MATQGQLSWQQLVAIARRVGVKVIEAPSSHRGKKGRMGSVVGVVEHTTGTPNSYRPADEYPDYNVVKEGRTGLVNTLSAYGLGRREAIYVFSEFLCWHAGEWSWLGITDGNGHFLGIECAGVGDYTPFQRAVYPRLVAAILLEIGAPSNMAPRHKDGAMPRGRKPDAQGFDGDWVAGASFYDWVNFFMANPAYINVNYEGENDMAGITHAEMLAMLRSESVSGAADAGLMLNAGYRAAFRQAVVDGLKDAGVATAADIARLPEAFRSALREELAALPAAEAYGGVAGANFTIDDIEAAAERAVRRVAADAAS